MSPRAPKNPALPKLYTTKQVADMYEVTAETVRNWIDRGQLRAIKVNGFYRIPHEDVLALARDKYGDTQEETA